MQLMQCFFFFFFVCWITKSVLVQSAWTTFIDMERFALIQIAEITDEIMFKANISKYIIELYESKERLALLYNPKTVLLMKRA